MRIFRDDRALAGTGRALAGTGLALAAALWLPVAAQAADPATVIATVDGTEITLGHVQVMRSQLPAQYQALPDDVLYAGIVEQLIQQTALARTRDGALTRRDEIAIENDRRAYLAGAALQAVAAAAVTPETLGALYTERFATTDPGTEYNAAHIIVATEAEAAALRAEIDGGADFAEMARIHSTDGAAAGGGALGWFGAGQMVKPFEDAVLAMQPGEVAGPIQTQFGWHLVLLNETRVAEAPPLDAVRAELAQELEQRAVSAHIAALTEAADISRSDEGIDPALMRDQTLFAD